MGQEILSRPGREVRKRDRFVPPISLTFRRNPQFFKLKDESSIPPISSTFFWIEWKFSEQVKVNVLPVPAQLANWSSFSWILWPAWALTAPLRGAVPWCPGLHSKVWKNSCPLDQTRVGGRGWGGGIGGAFLLSSEKCKKIIPAFTEYNISPPVQMLSLIKIGLRHSEWTSEYGPTQFGWNGLDL